MLLSIIFANLLAAQPPVEERGSASAARGRWDLTLAEIEEFLASPGAKLLGPESLFELRKRKARCLFELGDYPSSEREIRGLLKESAERGAAEHAECLAQLAKALTLQDIHEAALEAVEEALRLRDAPAFRRLAITVLLRAYRFAEIFPHAEALLQADDRDPYAHFVRGIALVQTGRLEEALGELSWGLEVPGAKRDARFQTALALGGLRQPERALEHLSEIIAEDPYDAEACYQAAQQLARLRTPGGIETAKRVREYFLALQNAQGEVGREHSFEAVGRATVAAAIRAARWVRLRVYDRALSEIRRAQAASRGDPEPFLLEAELWASGGFLAEAEASLSRLEGSARAVPEAEAARIEGLRAGIAARRRKLLAESNSPLGEARARVASASWEEARAPLEALLFRAAAAEDFAAADEAARWLLARDPRSIRALAFLTERTSDPSLLPPRLHYLSRLVPLLPEERRFRERLSEARAEFLGRIEKEGKKP